MVIVDNYIEDDRLLSKVNQDPFFNKEEPHWWGEFWIHPFSSLRQEVLSHLFLGGKRFVDTDISGFKHWVKKYEDTNPNIPVFDKDEECFKEIKQYSYPRVGAIYFYDPKVDETEGGYLQIWDDQEETPSYELVRPKYNRLVIFDISKLHTIQPITKGSFHYLNVSFWENPIWRYETFLK